MADEIILEMFADWDADDECWYNHAMTSTGITCVAGPYRSRKEAISLVASFARQMPGITQVSTCAGVALPGWSPGRQYYLISRSRVTGTRIGCGPFATAQDAENFEEAARLFWDRADEFPKGDVYHCEYGEVYPARCIKRIATVLGTGQVPAPDSPVTQPR